MYDSGSESAGLRRWRWPAEIGGSSLGKAGRSAGGLGGMACGSGVAAADHTCSIMTHAVSYACLCKEFNLGGRSPCWGHTCARKLSQSRIPCSICPPAPFEADL